MPDQTPLSTVKTGRVSTTAAGGEMTLLNMFLPRGLMSNNGDMLTIYASSQIAANGNSKTTKVYFGGTNIGGRTASDNGSTHLTVALVQRLTANTFQAQSLTANLISASVIVLNTDLITVDPNTPIEIKLTGQAPTTDGDIASRLLKYVYFPANSNFGIPF